MWARSFLSLLVAAPLVAGCRGDSGLTTAEIRCDQVSWLFRTDKLDGSPWVGSTELKPGQSMKLTLSGLWRQPDKSTVTGVCGDHVSDVTWEASDSGVAGVTPAPNLGAVVTARSAGVVDITARFVVYGVTPASTYLRITVTP